MNYQNTNQLETQTTTVKGGSIKRASNSGELISVETPSGTTHVSAETTKTVKSITAKRHDALQRLANR